MGGGREEQRKQDTRGRTEEVETKSDRKHTHTAEELEQRRRASALL